MVNQRETFRDIVDRLDPEGLGYKSSAAVGPHADTAVTLTADADLVPTGGQTQSPTGKAVFGSVNRR